MKKLFCVLILFVFLLPLACRYKDGPAINFHSVKNRLGGRWQVTGFTSDGVDSLQYYNDSCGCKMRIGFLSDENNIYFEECPPNKYKYLGEGGGYFYFVDNKKKMNLFLVGKSPFKGLGPIAYGGSSGYNCEWEILKLTKDELKISSDFNGRNYIISFKKE